MMKKLSALALALVMLLGVFGAFAENMPVSRAQQLLEEGKTLEHMVNVTVDEATVKGLLPLLAGGEMPEEVSALVSSFISALSKLRVRTLATMTEANTVVYTDKADILRIDAATDIKKGESTIVTDLLPGYAFLSKIDPDMTQLVEKLKANPEALTQLSEKYMALAAKWFEETMAPTMKTEEGEFVESQLKYDVKMTSSLSAEQVRGLLQLFVDEAKKDDTVKDLLNSILGYVAKTNAATSKDMSDFPANADAVLEKMEKALSEASPEDTKNNVLNLTVLKNKEGKGTAVILNDGDLPGKTDEAFYMSLAVQPTETGKSVRLLFINKKITEEDKTTGWDWDVIKNIAMMGGDPSLTTLRQDIDVTTKDGKTEVKGFMNLGLNGMPITLSITASETTQGEYAADQRIAIGFVTPDPLLVINTHTAVSDKMPTKADTEKATVINVEDLQNPEAQAEIQQKLTETLTGSLPQLMERLNAALPEEMSVIMQAVESFMQQQAPDMETEGEGQHATLGN